MNRRLASLLACITFLSFPVMPRLSAAPGAPVLVPEGDRFLFIVDTSSGMERLKEQIEMTIYDLLRSGLFGQMLTGDTYGMWTFDKETHAGKADIDESTARCASDKHRFATASSP